MGCAMTGRSLFAEVRVYLPGATPQESGFGALPGSIGPVVAVAKNRARSEEHLAHQCREWRPRRAAPRSNQDKKAADQRPHNEANNDPLNRRLDCVFAVGDKLGFRPGGLVHTGL